MAREKNPTVLQMDIVGLWASGLSTKDIAEKLNCSTETVRGVKKNDDLRQIFYERQSEQIIELVPFAIKRLRHILRDEETQASVAIAAIKEVFDRAHLTELTKTGDSEIKITVAYE